MKYHFVRQPVETGRGKGEERNRMEIQERNETRTKKVVGFWSCDRFFF